MPDVFSPCYPVMLKLRQGVGGSKAASRFPNLAILILHRNMLLYYMELLDEPSKCYGTDQTCKVYYGDSQEPNFIFKGKCKLHVPGPCHSCGIRLASLLRASHAHSETSLTLAPGRQHTILESLSCPQ
eukprot:g46951.t1